MNINFRKKNDSGFAVIESLLILIIIGAIVGIGSYVIHQKNAVKASLEGTSSTTTTTPATQLTVAPASKLTTDNVTTQDITKTVEKDASTETSIDLSSDIEIVDNSTSSDKATNNIGDSIDETNL